MNRYRLVLTALLITAASPAFAHPGHGGESGFIAGMLHPLTGIDHLLAMLMVGLWAGLAFPRRWWICPAIFVAFMIAGFGLGVAGASLPMAEMLILASLVVLGLALVFDLRPPLWVAAPLIALFAVGHGFAHGSELPAGGEADYFAAGFILSTIFLHASGIGIARFAFQSRRLGQTIGAGATITAAALLWVS
jgi:urease accessory protein